MALSEMSPVERIFGPLLPERDCGGCTACCTVPEIQELQKPADTTCGHCVDSGCSIYERRPSACRSFFCGWRRLEILPEDLRPDRCGIVMMLEVNPAAPNLFDRFCMVARWLHDGETVDSAVPDRLRQLLGKGFVPLFFSPYQSNRKFLVHPSPEIHDAIVKGARVSGKTKETVKRWQAMLTRRIVAHR